jgi:hypothetical protein
MQFASKIQFFYNQRGQNFSGSLPDMRIVPLGWETSVERLNLGEFYCFSSNLSQTVNLDVFLNLEKNGGQVN